MLVKEGLSAESGSSAGMAHCVKAGQLRPFLLVSIAGRNPLTYDVIGRRLDRVYCAGGLPLGLPVAIATAVCDFSYRIKLTPSRSWRVRMVKNSYAEKIIFVPVSLKLPGASAPQTLRCRWRPYFQPCFRVCAWYA
jgi:hypothetical protein